MERIYGMHVHNNLIKLREKVNVYIKKPVKLRGECLKMYQHLCEAYGICLRFIYMFDEIY